MSDLSQPRECGEWIQAWEKEIATIRYWGSREGIERWIRKLSESIESFEFDVRHCESVGRWPSGWRPDDVRSSLAMLREARDRAIAKLSGL